MHVRKSSLLFVLNRTFSGMHWSKGGGNVKVRFCHVSFKKEA